MNTGTAGFSARRDGRSRALNVLGGVEGFFVLILAVAISLSITASEIAFLTALAIRLVRFTLGSRVQFRPRSVWLGFGFLIASWTLSGFMWLENPESLFRVHRLYLVLVLFLVSEHAFKPENARRLAVAYLIGAMLSSTYGLIDWFRHVAESGLPYRLSGIFSTGMTAGNVYMTAFIASVCALLALRERRRILALVSSALAGAALVTTFTRSSWLGGLVGILSVLLVRRQWLMLVGLAVLLGVSAATVPAIRDRAMSAADQSHNTVQGRTSLWRSGLELFAEKPITGWGLADHSELIRTHRRADATFSAGHFHSNPVQIAVATGALGLLAYAFFNLAIGAILWRKRRHSAWALAGLGVWLAFHVAGFFDWSFGDAEVAYQYFFWMGVGLAAAETPR